RTSKFNDALGQFPRLQDVLSLHAQGILSDGSHNVAQYWVSRLSLNGPLTELYSSRVPVVPVRTIRICFDANDESYSSTIEIVWKPITRWLQDLGIDVGVDSSSCQ